MKRLNLYVALCGVLCIAGCSDNENGQETGNVSINVSIAGANDAPNGGEPTRSIPMSEQVTVPVDDGVEFVATLEKADLPQTRADSKPLASGVRYRVVAYQNDRYVKHADFQVGKKYPADYFHLPTGMYTFVCYSYNSTTELPDFGEVMSGISLTTFDEGERKALLYEQKPDVYVASGTSLSFTLYHPCVAVGLWIRISAEVSQYDAVVTNLGTPMTFNLVTGVFDDVNSQASYSYDARNNKDAVNQRSNIKTELQYLASVPDTKQIELKLKSITFGGTTYDNNKKGYSFTFKNNSKPLAGQIYYLKVNVKLDFIEQDNMLWSKGFLRYKNNTYSFTDNQADLSYSATRPVTDYWCYGGAKPEDPYVNTFIDVCTKVSPENTWRLPRVQELNSSFLSYGNNNRIKNTTYKNASIAGMYFDTKEKPSPDEADLYLFLPYGGSVTRQSPRWSWTNEAYGEKQGHIWVNEVSSDGRYFVCVILYGKTTTDLTTLLATNNAFDPAISSYPIRCVRNKK